MIYNLKALGANGDGKTDIAPLIRSTLCEIKAKGEPAEIIFEENAVYLFKSKGKGEIAIDLCSQHMLTLTGNNTTLLLDMSCGLYTYVKIDESSDIRLSGFNLKTSLSLYCLSKVEHIDHENLVLDIKCNHSLEIEKEFVPKIPDFFGVPYTDYNRCHIFLSRIEVLDAKKFRYRIFAKDKDNVHRKLQYLEDEKLPFLIPTPGWAQIDYGAFVVTHTNNLMLEDINMWSYGSFGFHMRYNYGEFVIKNVNLTPEPGTEMAITGWRDGFHLKENRCRFLFDKCFMEKVHDDIFNMSITNMYVNKIYSENEFNLYCREFGGTYWMKLKAGDRITFCDEKCGSFLKHTIIKQVVEQKGEVNRIIVEDKIPEMVEGISAFDNDLGQPDSLICNCKLHGTYRLRTPATFENCKFATMFAWIDNIPYCEGPIPENITFRNCKFYRVGGPKPEFNFGSADYMMVIGANAKGSVSRFTVKNIVFENCEINREELRLIQADGIEFREKKGEIVCEKNMLFENN